MVNYPADFARALVRLALTKWTQMFPPCVWGARFSAGWVSLLHFMLPLAGPQGFDVLLQRPGGSCEVVKDCYPKHDKREKA